MPFMSCTQGFIPGTFGVSHGALQFMAYEELKKMYNNYRKVPMETRFVSNIGSSHTCHPWPHITHHDIIMSMKSHVLFNPLNKDVFLKIICFDLRNIWQI